MKTITHKESIMELKIKISEEIISAEFGEIAIGDFFYVTEPHNIYIKIAVADCGFDNAFSFRHKHQACFTDDAKVIPFRSIEINGVV
jgi:hypothetical protein